MRPKTLALVTIGQSPRDDLTPDMLPLLSELRVIEEGALDELSPAEIAALSPAEGEGVLVSRLRGGGHAVLSEERVHAHVQVAVDRAVRSGADAVLIVCTGAIAELTAPIPVYMAEHLAHGAMADLLGDTPLTVVVPEQQQMLAIGDRWEARLARPVTVHACDPYTATAQQFAALGADLVSETASGTELPWVFLDCIGYSESMARSVHEQTGAQVYTARALAARGIAGLL